MPRTTLEIITSDIPQAPNLARIRCVITAIADGMTLPEQIAEETDISLRHVSYSIRAAQTLGLLDGDKAPTALGRMLLETDQESDAEREAFRRSIEESPIMRAIAPKLLSAKPPTKKVLGGRIERLSGLSKATAEHRASDILSWREQILDEAAGTAGPASTSEVTAADEDASPASIGSQPDVDGVEPDEA